MRLLVGPMLSEDSMRVIADSGVETFVEVGPGKVFSGLIKRIEDRAKTLNVEDMKSLEKTLGALGF